MEPIINPWWFYLIGVCDNVFIVLTFTSIFIPVIAGFTFMDDDLSRGNKDRSSLRKTLLKIWLVVVIVYCLFPCESTIEKMIAASLVTSDNIQAVQGNIIDFISQVADAVAKAKGH